MGGEPLAQAEVSLIPGAKGKETLEAKTDERGSFVFVGVNPGAYSLMTATFVESDAMPLSGPVTIDGPCSADGFFIIVTYGTSKQTGKDGFLAHVSTNPGEKLDVEAGERVVKDVVFECDE